MSNAIASEAGSSLNDMTTTADDEIQTSNVRTFPDLTAWSLNNLLGQYADTKAQWQDARRSEDDSRWNELDAELSAIANEIERRCLDRGTVESNFVEGCLYQQRVHNPLGMHLDGGRPVAGAEWLVAADKLDEGECGVTLCNETMTLATADELIAALVTARAFAARESAR